MKIFLLLSMYLLVMCSITFSQQCPPSGLKIQSPVCDSPHNLRANAACENLQVKWKGTKEQTYIVKATYADPSTSQAIELNTSQQSCDDNGNCSATIRVKEGTTVGWSVQSICVINGATFYSPDTEGEETFIPYCNAVTENINKENTDKNIRVYPNPTTGFLTVEYYSESGGDIEFKIYDMNGKMIVSQPCLTANAKTYNIYQIDLHDLAAGPYVLTVKNGNKLDRIKIILSGN